MRIEPSGFTHVVKCASMFLDSSEDRKVNSKSGGEEVVPTKEVNECRTSSSSTSSIGRNSDLSSERSLGDEDSGENEAESAYNGPLDMMDALEEVLPIRRGISEFYNGKSKSFTSLADASSSASSVKDIAKPENAYSRKRRNLMAFNQVLDKNRSFPLKSIGGGISKRPISSSRSTLALAVAMNNSESNSSLSEDSNSSSSPRSPPLLPPLHPQIRPSHNKGNGASSPLSQDRFCAWRSFSLADLQQCANAATTKLS
ncbi:MTD1 [Quillaja saponaria]|uniref:MTD1 n=1 Tax=Quillaja saponaria TaxID=32244 RepID=A0AAD7LHR5_QUISA|nr:MTD1 [Quillaja saponaria]KAJ7958416.1 MTD1 [Quillaja saponaria]